MIYVTHVYQWGLTFRWPRRSDAITPEHVSEAIQYRTFDRTLLGLR
jgi:hypothetical protein